MTTDSPRLFNDKSAIEVGCFLARGRRAELLADSSCLQLTGADMTRQAAQQAYKQAGITPADLSVIELHDCCASSFSIFSPPALLFCCFPLCSV